MGRVLVLKGLIVSVFGWFWPSDSALNDRFSAPGHQCPYPFCQ